MFHCEECSKVSEPNQKPNFFVSKKRQKAYHDRDGGTIGTGFETEKEVKLCSDCYGNKSQAN